MLRCHDGQAYYYDASLGNFEAFTGLLPQAIYGEIKSFLLTLEGLFRSFKGKVERVDGDLLDAINAAIEGEFGLDSVLLKFKDNAIFNFGNHLVKGRCKGKVKGEGDAEVEDVDSEVRGSHWYILTGQALNRASSQLQTELLGPKLMSYFIEWCQTSSPPMQGCCILRRRVFVRLRQ